MMVLKNLAEITIITTTLIIIIILKKIIITSIKLITDL